MLDRAWHERSPLVLVDEYLSRIQKGFPFKKGKPNLDAQSPRFIGAKR